MIFSAFAFTSLANAEFFIKLIVTGGYNTGWDAEIYYHYDSVTKRLDYIYTGSVEYGFTYDVFGNTTEISADQVIFAARSEQEERLAAILWTNEENKKVALFIEIDEKALKIIHYYNSSIV